MRSSQAAAPKQDEFEEILNWMKDGQDVQNDHDGDEDAGEPGGDEDKDERDGSESDDDGQDIMYVLPLSSHFPLREIIFDRESQAVVNKIYQGPTV